MIRDTLNFGVGMIFGLISYLFWNWSIWMYYFGFCPLAISWYIMINYWFYSPKQDGDEKHGNIKGRSNGLCAKADQEYSRVG
jgi:hypothetical protein